MAILSNAAYTLADLRASMDPDGKLTPFVNMLSQSNPVLYDIPWLPANQGMKHTTTILNGLPAAFWRMYNQGVPRSKSVKSQITETCAMLETYALIDKALAALNDNSAEWRLQEDSAFIDGMNQQMASSIFYQSQSSTPAAFTGLAPRLSTVNTAVAANAVNVLDAGGTGNTNTSIWLVGWGPNSVHGIYPKGSLAGLQVTDVTTNAPVYDDQGLPYQALQTHYKWDCGLAVRDWRYVVRIANIDVTQLTGSSAANLMALLIAAVKKPPVAPAGVSNVQSTTMAAGMPITSPRWVIYCNRTASTAMELQILNKSNGYIQLAEYGGMVVNTFRGIPIRDCDAILNTEARVV